MGSEAKRLWSDLCKGRPEAWAEFVDQTLGAVTAAVRRALGMYSTRVNEADVEDIAAACYGSLVRDGFRILRRLREPYDLRAFMVVTAKRRAIDALRVRQRAVRTFGLEAAQELRLHPVGTPQEETALNLEEAMATVGPREAMLVRLVYVHGKSYREAASLVGIPLNGVGPTLARALKKIRNHLHSREPR